MAQCPPLDTLLLPTSIFIKGWLVISKSTVVLKVVHETAVVYQLSYSHETALICSGNARKIMFDFFLFEICYNYTPQQCRLRQTGEGPTKHH